MQQSAKKSLCILRAVHRAFDETAFASCTQNLLIEAIWQEALRITTIKRSRFSGLQLEDGPCTNVFERAPAI